MLGGCSAPGSAGGPATAAPATTAPTAVRSDPSSAAKGPAGRTFRHYVALGDSYTAGPLIPRLRLDPAGCLRSTHNYPAYLAAYLDAATYRDASCSGATTADVTSGQAASLGSTSDRNPPQLEAVRGDTDLVTVGIGGNDFDLYATLTSRCEALARSDPSGAPCERAFGRDSSRPLAQTAAAVAGRIASVVRAVRARAPRAAVVVVGYPQIVPTDRTCGPTLSIAAGDQAWADAVERALNAALRRGARTSGATYADVYTASRGHDVCAGRAAWVNGAQGDSRRAAAYHPFDVGMRGTAATVYRLLIGATPPDRPPYDSGAPTP